MSDFFFFCKVVHICAYLCIFCALFRMIEKKCTLLHTSHAYFVQFKEDCTYFALSLGCLETIVRTLCGLWPVTKNEHILCIFWVARKKMHTFCACFGWLIFFCILVAHFGLQPKRKNFFALALDLSAAFHGALPEILTMGRHCKAARSFVGE